LLKLLGQVVVKKRTPPGTAETDFAREMQDYIRANHKRFVKSGEKLHLERHWAWQDWDSESDDEAAQPRDKGTRDFLRDLTDFSALWNGAWWNHSCVIHHCAGPACCSSYEDTQRRMGEASDKIIWISMVPTVCANKWSKLGPCLDWILNAYMVHGALAICAARSEHCRKRRAGCWPRTS
jgi:hypothetical protein